MGVYGNEQCSFDQTGITVELDPRSAARIAPGFHHRQLESRDPAAGDSDGAGDGAGIAVRGGGRILGGRLGADAVATVGLTESLLSLVFAIGLGLSLSTTAMVARRIGEKDPPGAAVAGVQAIVLGLSVSLLIGVPCFLFAPKLLQLMGASPEMVQSGSGYARIALGGSGAILMLFLNNAIFRGAGDAAIAMRLLWVSNIINLILDPCLFLAGGRSSKTGGDRGCAGDVYGTEYWSRLPILPPAARI